ncbi:unnamed protein product [Lymnaea stagnalis]|uniref:Charged multivesicular body protein 7 n=1 Tax=Lymnaea stagnalis TaxID=6523 RepID=A0AAV2IEF2_LYMST
MALSEKAFLPPELEDDQQAAVLYSPFRDKSLNPNSWNRKMKFWENWLSKIALERQCLTFDLNLLPSMFERKGITPKCFATVIEELAKTGRVKSIEEFKKSNSWLSWGFNTLVKQPLTWSVGRLVGSSTANKATLYVWPEVVKKISEQLLADLQASMANEMTSNLLSVAELRNHHKLSIRSDEEFELILTQLQHDRKIVLRETEEKEMIVKFCKQDATKVENILDFELQVYQIQKTLKKLEKEIEDLSVRNERLVCEAKLYLREGKKAMALHSLRKKKSLLKTIERKSASLVNLQSIVEKIEDASTNEMVIKACEAGLMALKSLNNDLTVEKAEAIVDGVQEALENQDEINKILSTSSTSYDEDEDLEKDLDELLKDYGDKTKLDYSNQPGKHEKTEEIPLDAFQSLTLDDLGLPNVPSRSPSQSDHAPSTNDKQSGKLLYLS